MASENQQKRRGEGKRRDKVEVAPGVTVGSLRRFKTELIGPIKGLPEAASAAPLGKPENVIYLERARFCSCFAFGCKCEALIIAIRWGASDDSALAMYACVIAPCIRFAYGPCVTLRATILPIFAFCLLFPFVCLFRILFVFLCSCWNFIDIYKKKSERI